MTLEDTRPAEEIRDSIAKLEEKLERITLISRERALMARIACLPDADFIGHIQEQASILFSVPIECMTAKSRPDTDAHARQAAMWVIRETRPWIPFATIGAAFNKDHGTVIYGCDAVVSRLESGDTRWTHVNQLTRALRELAITIQQRANKII